MIDTAVQSARQLQKHWEPPRSRPDREEVGRLTRDVVALEGLMAQDNLDGDQSEAEGRVLIRSEAGRVTVTPHLVELDFKGSDLEVLYDRAQQEMTLNRLPHAESHAEEASQPLMQVKVDAEGQPLDILFYNL